MPPWAKVLRSGPIYVSFGARSDLRLHEPPAPFFADTGWNGGKVGWISAKSYTGPVVIRGARIDAPGELAFHGHTRRRRPVTALQFAPQAMNPNGSGVMSGYRWWGGTIWVKSAGCYALQVDGTSFSTSIVFEVTSPDIASP